MDEDFDKYEFELRKKEQEEEKKERGPVYNTKIEGLVVEASLPVADNYKKYQRKEESKGQS